MSHEERSADPGSHDQGADSGSLERQRKDLNRKALGGVALDRGSKGTRPGDRLVLYDLRRSDARACRLRPDRHEGVFVGFVQLVTEIGLANAWSTCGPCRASRSHNSTGLPSASASRPWDSRSRPHRWWRTSTTNPTHADHHRDQPELSDHGPPGGSLRPLGTGDGFRYLAMLEIGQGPRSPGPLTLSSPGTASATGPS